MQGMMFKRGSDDMVVIRSSWNNGIVPCINGSGQTGCGGSACAYGPLAWSAAQFVTGTAATVIYDAPDIGGPPLYLDLSNCAYGSSLPKGDTEYPNVTGTIDRNAAGCCENGKGPCGFGSYPSCSTCSTGGNVEDDIAYYQY